ncbi:MAG TPA: GNAT family N-acetyltransferase [Acidimicrobiales bacterium]|nr:GNAT family N-acetyltransferase [Acidimicrobiales bacterium]
MTASLGDGGAASPVRLRDEQPAGERLVEAVQRAAFGDEGDAVARLLPLLRGLILERGGCSLVAEEPLTAEAVGHVMCTRALLDTPRRLVEVQVLSPLGVLPAYRSRGVGAALVAAAVDRAAAEGVPLVFLEGSPRYYSRFGFRPGGDLGFRKPSLRIPDTAFQVIALPAHEAWMTGTLVYPDAFWECDCVGLREAAGG